MLKSEKQKLISKANKFDKIMARKVKTFLSKFGVTLELPQRARVAN